jgi:hypothetical protein
MDNILVLAPTRWKLRQAVKVVNQGLTALRLDKHPEKTFIGRIVKGFDFLGYHFSPDGLTIAKKTLDNFVVRVRQLYEQKLEEHVSTRLGAYVRRWVRWIVSGLLLSPQIRRRVLTILDLAVQTPPRHPFHQCALKPTLPTGDERRERDVSIAGRYR